MAELRKIYEVRSNIVRSGKARLSKDERYLFYRLQRMAQASISKEIGLLETAAASATQAQIINALKL